MANTGLSFSGQPGLSYGTPQGQTYNFGSFSQLPAVNTNQAFASGGLSYTAGAKPAAAPTQGVLGAGSTQPAGYAGNGSFGDPNNPDLSNPSKVTDYNNYLASQQDAARNSAEGQLSAANTAYDYNAAQLNDQLGSLGNQKQQALSEIDLGLTGLQNQIGTSRTNAQTNTEGQIKQAGSIAKSTQAQNRNVLRALGIINSTAAGDLLSKPMNEFDKQRATLNQALGQRFQELDDTLNQKTAEANSQKNGIISQFTDLVGKIQTDLRFNDRQRTDAVKQANSALQQRLADIQGSVLQYQQQVALQKQNFAQSLAQIAAYQNPTIATDLIRGTGLSTGGAQTNTAQIYQDPNQKKQQPGLSGY